MFPSDNLRHCLPFFEPATPISLGFWPPLCLVSLGSNFLTAKLNMSASMVHADANARDDDYEISIELA